MTEAALGVSQRRIAAIEKSLWFPLGAALLVFAALYAKPAYLLVRDWTNFDNPDSGTGLLLAPLAFWFAFQTGVKEARKPAVDDARGAAAGRPRPRRNSGRPIW